VEKAAQYLRQASVQQQVAMREIEAQHSIVTPPQTVPLVAVVPTPVEAVKQTPPVDAQPAVSTPSHVDTKVELTYQQALQNVANHACLTLGTPQWQHNRFQIPDNQDPLAKHVSMNESSRDMTFQLDPKDSMSVFSWYPIPSHPSATFYYEVRIKTKTASSACAIGIAVCPYPTSQMVGQTGTSIAYHSDDGRIMWSDEQVLKLPGETNVDAKGDAEYGPPYGQGDVIGVAYRPADGLVFFTRNGIELGTAKTGFAVGRQLFASLGFQGQGEVEGEFRTWTFHV
jgi:hypothetical protein